MPSETTPASPPLALEATPVAEIAHPLGGDAVVPPPPQPARRRSRTRPFFERLQAGQIAFGVTPPHAGCREEISRTDIVRALFVFPIEDVRKERDGTLRVELYGEFASDGAAKAYGGRTSSDVGKIRDSPIEKGMIYGPAHGDAAFTAPLFDAFMRRIAP